MGMQAAGAAVGTCDVVSNVTGACVVVETGVGAGAGAGTGEPLMLSVFLKVPGEVKAHWLMLLSKQDGPVISCAMFELNPFL